MPITDLDGNIFSQLEYIKLNLSMMGMCIDDLKDIFDVTKTTIEKWKKGENISRDKIVYLSKMFGVTLDQFYAREISADYYFRFIHGLNEIVKDNDYKKLTELDIDSLFEINEKIKYYIKYVLSGIEGECDVSPYEFDYFCRCLDITYDYYLNAKEDNDPALVFGTYKLNAEYLKYAREKLKKSWGDIDISDKFNIRSIDIIEIMLMSENIKAIQKKSNLLDSKKIMNKYVEIKEKIDNFDIDGKVFKTLIANGFVFWNENKKDINKTYKFLKEIICKDVRNLIKE